MTKPNLYGLYAITDAELMADNFAAAVSQTLQGGTRIIQYRDKSEDNEKRLQQALLMRELCDQHEALLIINDDIELAIQSDADGVHIGKDDAEYEKARQCLGTDKIIGISCYNQLELAIEAEQKGADYVAFGAFFSSSIKPEASNAPLTIISQAKQRLSCPVCCIGGINADNAGSLIAAGGDMIAVISDIFSASEKTEGIKQASIRLSQLFSA